MAFNGSGVFSRLYNWVTEQASSPIEISKLDAQEEDIASALSNCILRDGTGVPTSATPWNSQNLTGVGSLTAVSGTFSSTVTATGAITASALIPSSSTVPANGVYLPAANTVGVASNTTLRASVNSTGNWTFAAPSSGGHTFNAPTGGDAITVSDGTLSLVHYHGGGQSYFGNRANISMNLMTNGVSRMQFSGTGNVTINAPSSGYTLDAVGVANTTMARFKASSGWGGVAVGGGTSDWILLADNASSGAFSLYGGSSPSSVIDVSSGRNVTINAASSGDELTVIGSVVATSFTGALTGDVTGNVSGSSGSTTGNAATATALQTARTINGTSFNGTANITVTASADTLTGSTLPALSGVNLTALNASNLASGTVPAARIGSSTDYAIGDGSTVNSIQIGFRGIPQNAQTGNYTCVLADAGKHIYHASGAGSGDTYTIPSNASVAYAVGTAITFINRDTTNAVTIAITSDTLTQAGTGSTGSRTLGTYGVATAIKITSTEWIISGTNLS